MNIEIPDKLYFKIGEVAKMAEVPPHVLRYWESEFSGIKPKRASSKQRLYRRQDVELILKIKMLLHHQGYTIAGARKVLASGQEIGKLATADQPASPGDRVTDKLSTLKQELIQLQQLLTGKKEN